MIVIATHDGMELLPPLLNSLETYGTNGNKVLVVDTQSKDTKFQSYLKDLPGLNKLDLIVTQSPYCGYDTGAYIWAHQNYRSSEYMFMQDSMLVKSTGWLNDFTSLWAPHIGIVAWQMFGPRYDNDEEITFVEKYMHSTEMSKGGIFGPIFYTKCEVMDRFESLGFLKAIPTNKNDQMAMERGWSVACKAAGYECVQVRPYDRNAMYQDTLPTFKKLFPGRP